MSIARPSPQQRFLELLQRGFIVSANTEQELRAIRPGSTWSSAPAVLLQQDPQARYVETILQRLKPLLRSTT
jgi:hypothetical protein